MNIKNKVFFHVGNEVNWEKDQTYFVGEGVSPRYLALMSRGFSLPVGPSQQAIPVSSVAEGMAHFLQRKEKAPFLAENYHHNPEGTLMEILPAFHAQMVMIRELIFEETRKESFSDKTSRYKGIQVVPATKNALAFWLPKLKTLGAKIYKVELTGKLHRASAELLVLNSLAPQIIKMNAYKYWLGNEKSPNDNDECTFEGFLKVQTIIDANTKLK